LLWLFLTPIFYMLDDLDDRLAVDL